MDNFYFFRDLRNDDNLDGNYSFHAAGLVLKFVNSKETANGNKDISVLYFAPFQNEVISAWRTYSEVELFQTSEYEYNLLKETLKDYLIACNNLSGFKEMFNSIGLNYKIETFNEIQTREYDNEAKFNTLLRIEHGIGFFDFYCDFYFLNGKFVNHGVWE